MKTLNLILITILIPISICYSQFPDSYPYKAIQGDLNEIYMTGDTTYQDGSTDFVVRRYLNRLLIGSVEINNPYGNERGYDIIYDNNINRLFVYATGYTINQNGNRELTLIKLSRDLTQTYWIKKYDGLFNSSGIALTIDVSGELYVTGYTEGMNNFKDLLILKCSKTTGSIIWEHTYNNRIGRRDDIGTSILVDTSFVYVMGSTYNGKVNDKDIILLNYRLDGSDQEVDIYEKAKSHETPTNFVFSEKAGSQEKSRITIASVSENMSLGGNPTGYVTIDFTGGSQLNWHWTSTFQREIKGENVSTAIDADATGNVYVSGYCFSSRNNFDYGTMKYNYNGQYGWQNMDSVQFFDAGGDKDKASSVKVNGNSVYVTGSSASTPGGFETKEYIQGMNGTVSDGWSNTFTPEFGSSRADEKRAAQLIIDYTTGNVTVLVMRWGGLRVNSYAIRAYDNAGNILYTIDYNQDGNEMFKQLLPSESTKDNFSLNQNFPNPFNPSTVISYRLAAAVNVNLKVYDATGKEIVTLVNELQPAGNYEAKFNASDLPSGIYYYKLTSGEFVDTKRMILIK